MLMHFRKFVNVDKKEKTSRSYEWFRNGGNMRFPDSNFSAIFKTGIRVHINEDSGEKMKE